VLVCVSLILCVCLGVCVSQCFYLSLSVYPSQCVCVSHCVLIYLSFMAQVDANRQIQVDQQFRTIFELYKDLKEDIANVPYSTIDMRQNVKDSKLLKVVYGRLAINKYDLDLTKKGYIEDGRGQTYNYLLYNT